MRKLISIILSAAMILCFIPSMAFAATTATSGDLAKAKVIAITDQVYTGQEVKPAVTLTLENGDAVPTTGYTVTYKDNTAVGTATATITGTGAFTGGQNVTFKIVPKAFSNTTKPEITVPNQLVGTKALAGVSVKDGSLTLKEGTDYTLPEVDNAAAGTKSATITFIGNYSGTVDANYQVVASELKGAIYLKDTAATYVFDGTAKTPEISVKDAAGKELVSGTDYKVVYLNNTAAGKATIQVVGAGNYAGTLTQEFKINSADLSKATLTINPTEYTYTGAAVTPVFTVKSGTYELKATDYTVVLSNNTNTGDATLKLTGAGNFAGTLTGTFKIVAADYTKFDVTLEKTTYDYTGKAITPTMTVKQGTYTMVKDTDYTVTYANNTNAGKATVTVTGKGKFAGTKTVEFTIKGLENAVTTTYTTYTKYPISQTFNLNAKSTGNEGTIGYKSDNEKVATVSATGDVTIVGVGTAKITVSTVGTTKYDPASKEVTVNVKPSKPSFTAKSAKKANATVKVKTVKGATNYQIRYGRSGSYKNTYVAGADKTSVSKTIKSLKSGKSYYVKVRSYTKLDDGTKIFGNWSSSKTVKVK